MIICLLAGLGAGLGTGFAGMSAAVVISPMLITFLDRNPYEAIGIALASDVLASAVSAYTYGKNKNIDLKRAKTLFIAVLVFTGIGAYIAFLVPPATMGNLTVYSALLMGINFLKKSFSEEKVVTPKEFSGNGKQMVPILCGALIGFICGFIGAGGGIMMLMILTLVMNFELKTAVGTSVFIMTFTALYGSISHFSLHSIIPDPVIMGLCVGSTLFFARMGSVFANKAEAKILNRATGVVLSSLGIFMLWATYF
ncbi:MAG: sulfite exporter TauE/SafE family protein [Eubacteriales bacterium]